MASSPAEKSMANWVALAKEQLAQKKNSDALLSLRKVITVSCPQGDFGGGKELRKIKTNGLLTGMLS